MRVNRPEDATTIEADANVPLVRITCDFKVSPERDGLLDSSMNS